jgi:outer membrane protein assembly factor BamA
MSGFPLTLLAQDTINAGEKDSYWRRLFNGHIDRTFEKKLDVSFIAAPSYTREASFGLGGAATGLYRTDRTNLLMPPSDITITANVSVNGFFSLSATGNNNFKGNRSSLAYQISFFNKNADFWGINFDDCEINPKIGYRRQTVKIYADYRYELYKYFYVGGTLDYLYTNAAKIDDETYLLGQLRTYTTTGFGLTLQHDTRDFIPNPQKGMYFLLRQTVYPGNYGNTNRTLLRTTFIANFYPRLWKSAILAFDIYGQISSNNLPWTLMEELGGNIRMRGYYRGRYVDNNIATVQAELRQHIYKRLGFAGWIGCGTVFPSIKQFDVNELLPNYGLGLRIEIKHNVNARIDFGMGKQTRGFVFGINEAF